MNSNGNSFTSKQTFILSRILFFPVQTVSTDVYLTATIKENCSRSTEVAAKFPEMVR